MADTMADDGEQRTELAGHHPRGDGDDDINPAPVPVLIIVMGVSGCGKSTLGAALARALSIPFIDADALHPHANIDKMARGVPLTDEDRLPWLRRVREEAVGAVGSTRTDLSRSEEEEKRLGLGDDGGGGVKGIVVGCSALKRSYRDILRGLSPSPSSPSPSSSPLDLPTYFIYIRGPRPALLQRMTTRRGHFMKSSMLDSQLATLEPPDQTGEDNVVVVDLEMALEDQVRVVRQRLSGFGLGV